MDLGIRGKQALVTGGTSGIGLAIAKALLSEGCQVVVASRKKENLEAALKLLRKEYPKEEIDARIMDLSIEQEIRDGVSEMSRARPIDILVINCGGPASGSPLEIPLEEWDKGYSTLLRSVILLSHMVIPQMKEKKWGRILTVTSTSAREVLPNLPVSSTFRAGLTAWTKSLAKEIGKWEILVNNLLPGPTNTARLKELAIKNPTIFRSMQKDVAVGRIAEPEEIGKVAAFLCSGANSFITGTDVLADGGYTFAL